MQHAFWKTKPLWSASSICISFNLCKSDILQIHEYYTFVHYNTLFSLKLNMYDLVSMLLYNALPNIWIMYVKILSWWCKTGKSIYFFSFFFYRKMALKKIMGYPHSKVLLLHTYKYVWDISYCLYSFLRFTKYTILYIVLGIC